MVKSIRAGKNYQVTWKNWTPKSPAKQVPLMNLYDPPIPKLVSIRWREAFIKCEVCAKRPSRNGDHEEPKEKYWPSLCVSIFYLFVNFLFY